jgi:hypothetical protein
VKRLCPLLGSFTSSDDMFVNRGNIAIAYLSHSSRLLSKIAELLGRDREAEHYGRSPMPPVPHGSAPAP